MSSGEWSVVISSLYFGGLIGNILSEIMVMFIPPLYVLWLGNIPLILGIISHSLFSSIYTFILGRALIGFCGGISHAITPIYISEITPKSLRGSFGIVLTFFHFFSGLISQTLGIFMSSHPYWRIILVFPIITMILQIIILPLCPKSPRWLIRKKRFEEAKSSLKRLRKRDDVNEEFKNMKEKIEESETLSKSVPFSQKIFSKVVVKNLVLVSYLQFMKPTSGSNVVNQYSTAIFILAGVTIPSISTVIVSICTIIGVVISIFLVDKLGRRPLFLIGSFGQAFSFLIISLSFILIEYASWFGWIALLSILLFTLFNSSSLAPLPTMMTTELFPEDLEQFAVTFGLSVSWLFCGIVTLIYPFLQEGLGKYTFIPFFFLNALLFIAVLIFLPETKGKSLEDLQKIFSYLTVHQQRIDDEKKIIQLIEEEGENQTLFKEYLNNENTIDNFNFVQKVRIYQKTPSIDLMNEIYEKYIKNGSDFQLEFSVDGIQKVSKDIEKNLEKEILNEHIFDDLYNEMKNTLIYESYIRYNESLFLKNEESHE